MLDFLCLHPLKKYMNLIIFSVTKIEILLSFSLSVWWGEGEMLRVGQF